MTERTSYLRPTKATIYEERLKNNLSHLTRRLKPHQQILGIVKANAYGHGLVETSRALLRLGSKVLGVADLSEALTLRKAGIKGNILCLGPLPDEGLPEAQASEVIVTLFSQERLDAFLKHVRNTDQSIRVHIKLDTGMNRLGFESSIWESIAKRLKEEPRIQVEGIFSHLAESENHDPTFTNQQYQLFVKGVSIFEQMLGKKLIRHLANSSGILSHDFLECNWVRAGIAAYGYPWEEEGKATQKFLPILEWTAPIIQTKMIGRGDTVGYNRTFKADRKMKIGTVAVGYGDGFLRSYSKVKVGFRNQRTSVLGIICMDLLMVDLTPFPDATVGESVTLLGNGSTGPTAWEYAEGIQTIPYEILTSIHPRVTREWV